MKLIFSIIQILLSIGLITLIFLQPSNDLDGRSGNLFSGINTEKRGWEKVMFYLTLIVLFLFIVSSIILTTV